MVEEVVTVAVKRCLAMDEEMQVATEARLGELQQKRRPARTEQRQERRSLTWKQRGRGDSPSLAKRVAAPEV